MMARFKVSSVLPSDFTLHPHCKGLIAQMNLRYEVSRLACKVLVFDTRQNMLAFAAALGSINPKRTNALVHTLHYEVVKIAPDGKETTVEMIDGRYFAVAMFHKRALFDFVIAHECVHIAYALYRRAEKKFRGNIFDFDEERIAYPAGDFTATLCRWLLRKGLIGSKAC